MLKQVPREKTYTLVQLLVAVILGGVFFAGVWWIVTGDVPWQYVIPAMIACSAGVLIKYRRQ